MDAWLIYQDVYTIPRVKKEAYIQGMCVAATHPDDPEDCATYISEDPFEQ